MTVPNEMQYCPLLIFPHKLPLDVPQQVPLPIHVLFILEHSINVPGCGAINWSVGSFSVSGVHSSLAILTLGYMF